MIILIIISFLGLAYWFSKQARITHAAGIFLTAASIVCAVYAFGFSNFLKESISAILSVGLALSAFYLFRDFRTGTKTFCKSLISLPIAIFSIFVLLFFISFRGAWFLQWDEISHWGLVLKEMLLYGRNLVSSDVSWLSIYPPGAAAFQYYFCALLGNQEGYAYVAQATLMLAPLIQLLDLKPPYRIAGRGVFIIAFCLNFALFNGWKMIYVDAAVSGFFAGALVFYLTNRPFSFSRLLWLTPVFVAIGLIKYIGNLLSIITLVIVVADTLIDRKAEFVSLLNQKARLLKRTLHLVLVVAALFAVPKFSLLIWSNRTIETILRPIAYTPREPITAQNIAAVFSGDGLLDYQKTLIVSFKNALDDLDIVQQKQSFVASVKLFAILLIVLAAFAIWRDRKKRKLLLTSQIILTTGFVLYTFGLLVLYLYRFNEYEGSHLASFARYMCIFLNAWIIVTFMQTTGAFEKKRSQIILLTVFTAFICLFFNTSKIINMFTDTNVAGGLREEIHRNVQPVVRGTDARAKVYVIWQKTAGFELFIHRYELAPRTVNLTCWGLGKPWDAGDIWTCDKSLADLKADLLNYDYLYLGFTNEEFWNGYSGLFEKESEPEKHRLFQIQKSDTLTLKPLD